MRNPPADNLPWPVLPNERAGLLSFDPPWHFESRAPVTNPHVDRSPQKHYPTADLEHMKTIPVKELALPDAYVALWITGPLLVKGVHNILFRHWGVRPVSTGFVWIKLRDNFDAGALTSTPLLENDLAFGMGYSTRQNAEFCMLGRIGSPKVGRHDIRQVIISNRREHSRKPEEYYRRLEHFCAGPRLDGFGGAPRKGWIHWGYGHREGEATPYSPAATV